MKTLTLVVCLSIFLVACGSGGSNNSAENVTMQGGQWEYAVVPENAAPMYIDFNQGGSNGALSVSNAVIFNPAEVNLPGANSALYCAEFQLNANISDATLKGNVIWGLGQSASHFADFTGDLASNGQSISKGTYSGQFCDGEVSPNHPGPNIKAAFTGYMISPLNGTFTGTLESNLYGSDVVTFSITQNPDFSLNVTGTSTENGVTSTFAASTVPTDNSVNGGTVYIYGTYNNVNGSEVLNLSGHLNPNATQITIANMNISNNEYVTGSLTKK
jgi:hypothetical protein